MAEENKCKVCGEGFEEKEDLTAHGKNNHPVFTEAYAKEGEYGIGGRPKNEDDRAEDLYDQFDEQDIDNVNELVDQGTDRTDAITKVAKDAGYEAFKCKDCGKEFSDLNAGVDHRLETNHDVAEEIDQQKDKPVQTHDEWQKELQGLQDEFSEEGGAGSGRKAGGYAPLPEQTSYQDNPSYDPYTPTPKSDLLQTDPYVTRTTEGEEEDEKQKKRDYFTKPEAGSKYSKWELDSAMYGDVALPDKKEGEELVWNGEHYVKAKEQEAEPSINMQDEEGKPIDQDKYNKWEKEISAKPAEEDRGTDAILGKVANLAGGEANLAENYRFLSKDVRAKIFESIGLNQGDANILAGLQWNELTRPVRVEATEAYSKELNEDEEKLERYSRVNEPDDYESEQEQREEAKQQEEDESYENFYNLEKNHSSPDYKKKAIECNRCNEAFYNTNDRDIHYNEVHATEDTYNLPEECPFCKIIIPEGQDLDYHMSTAHGAHVPSEYTQTGVDAGMSDANWDRIEYAGASYAKEKGETYIFMWRVMDFATRENMMREVGVSTSEAGSDWEQLPYEVTEPLKQKMNQLFRETGRESKAREGGWTDDWLSIKTPTIGDIPSFVSSMAKGYGSQLGNIINDKSGEWKIQIREGGEWVDTSAGGTYLGKDGAEYDANNMSQITRVVKVGESKAREAVPDCEECGGDGFIDVPDRNSEDGLRQIPCEKCDDYDQFDTYDESKANEGSMRDNIWGLLVYSSRMAFLDDYQGEMNIPLMITTGAMQMPNSVQEVADAIGVYTEQASKLIATWSYENGITDKLYESKARVIKPGDPDYEKEMAIIDDWNNLGASIKAQGLSKDELKKRGILFLESKATEAKIPSGDLYQYGSKVGTIRDYNPKQHEGYVTLDGIGIEEFGAMTSDYEVRVNGERIPNKWDGKHDYNLDLFGESRSSDIKKEIKYLQGIIQVASEENPLHMYIYHDKIAELESELSSLGESKATEHISDEWWWKEVKWESGFDQDFLYCNHCGADLYAEASWVEPLNNVGDDKMNRVVPDHLRRHGISNEVYAKETNWDDLGLIDKQDILYVLDEDKVDAWTKWENLPSDLQTKIVRGGALESYAKEQEDDDEHDDEYDDKGYHKRSGTSDFRTWQKRTGMLEDKDDAEEEEDVNPNDPRQPTMGGYDPELDSDDPNDEYSEEADTRWIKGQDEKWHEIDSSDRDYEQGVSEKPAEAKEQEDDYKEFKKQDKDTQDQFLNDMFGYDVNEDDKDEAEEQEGENECEGCGRLEDFLNDENLCEDCEREAGIDRKESERDAYD